MRQNKRYDMSGSSSQHHGNYIGPMPMIATRRSAAQTSMPTALKPPLHCRHHNHPAMVSHLVCSPQTSWHHYTHQSRTLSAGTLMVIRTKPLSGPSVLANWARTWEHGSTASVSRYT